MNFIVSLSRAVTRLNSLLGVWILSYLVIVMVVLLLFEIVARYVFSSPTIWASEMTQMMFGAYIILSGGFLLVRKGHINVDILYDRLGAHGKAAVNIATCFLFFAFMAVILKEGWVMAEESWAMGETSFSAWNPPIWPLKIAIPVGAMLLLLQGVVSIVGDVFVLMGRPDLARRIEGEGVTHDA
ncbi:TRAP transporter small permease subunit [Marinobacter sp. M1N3S26]|uniref:TRAP transporter small permease subunit n=1 Tax=unclassified Marinobacter TaxID=83889 RepID=UPI00387AD957